MAVSSHDAVLVEETVALLAPARGGLFVDCTVGLGGHSRALLDAGASRILGIDRDPDALRAAAASLAPYGDRVELVHADFRDLARVLDDRGIAAVAGALADLGVSSMQLDSGGRGFSFRRDEPLDMRMDRTQGPTVAELLVKVPEAELADLIYRYGEERYSRRIARAIVRAREEAAVSTTGQLAQIVRRAIPRRGHQRIDPATRTFQALRIWANRELEGLEAFLGEAYRRLLVGARLAVISFHSLEDRIVKHVFRALTAGEAAVRILTKRPIEAGEAEVSRNPRSRSAKLRAIERLA
ncbi:MAG TPA: 16S rRNA (cytosine(1402)-N(4))-methyltransferase RsmH [Vicinamibacterales bacterium]|nr:16S rRNA (cytosine(1402)-N(4))-methyltransferase RsmH [Vicinamibacterales bacterium]